MLLLPSQALSASKTPSVHGEYALIGALHRTGGSGDRTLLKRGEFLRNELKLAYEQPLWGDWQFDTDVHLRKTNDPQIDTRNDVHLLGWTSELYNRYLRLTAGDFYGDFTQYTFSQPVKGAQVRAKNETFEAKGIAGYTNKRDHGRQFLRYVYGGRTEALVSKAWGPMRDLRVGANFSGAEDDHATIDTTTGVTDSSNRVGSVSGTFTVHKTEVEAEAARSWLSLLETPTPTALTAVNRTTGTALRVNTLTRVSKDTRFKLNYEWVAADFGTLNGSAVPDRVNLLGRLDHKFNRQWASEASYRVTHDKLNKSSLNKRTVTQTPRLALNWTPQSENWVLKDYFMRFYYDMRNRDSQDDPAKIDFLSHEFGIEDEFMVRDVSFTSGWSIRDEDDDLTPANNRLYHTAYLGFKMRRKFQTVLAIPSVRWQVDVEEAHKENGTNVINALSAGLLLDFGERLKVNQRYSVSPANRFADSADSIRWNAFIGLDYKIPCKKDLTFQASYEHTGFAHDRSTERFSEHNFQTGLIYKF